MTSRFINSLPLALTSGLKTSTFKTAAFTLSLALALTSATTFGQAVGPKHNAPEAKQVMTQGLNHLGLTVAKLDETVAFFTDVLGWRDAGGDPSYPARFVSDGKIFVTLWQATANQPVVAFNRKNNIGLHHLALSVASFADLETLHERFKTAPGVVIEFAPQLNRGGPTKHMMIREPSGNRIEFAHNPPKVN